VGPEGRGGCYGDRKWSLEDQGRSYGDRNLEPGETRDGGFDFVWASACLPPEVPRCDKRTVRHDVVNSYAS
jgi:hypothetical protein